MTTSNHTTQADQRSQAENQLESEFAQLDALFDTARAAEPEFLDDNFTKSVINQLPTAPNRIDKKGLSFDLIALVLGVLAAALVVDINALTSYAAKAVSAIQVGIMNIISYADFGVSVVSLIPFGLVGLFAVLVTAVSAIGAWLLVERPQLA